MFTSITLLKIIGHLWIETNPAAFFGKRICNQIWKQWDQTADPTQKRNELQALAQTDAASFAEGALSLLAEFGVGQSEEKGQMLWKYWQLMPGAVRQNMRRLEDPQGTTIAPDFSLETSDDLQAVLPKHLPCFQPGDRPDGIGDWRLEELLVSDEWSETWRATAPGVLDKTQATMTFFPDKDVQEFLRKECTKSIDQIRELAQKSGLLELHHVYINADPICMQFENINDIDVIGVVRSQPAHLLDPQRATELIRQLAQILAPLHQATPPLIHGALCPSRIFARPATDGSATWQCKLFLTGLADLRARFPRITPDVYDSPQRSDGKAFEARDDIFALGVLWYQLLTGNWSGGRPGGSRWRRQLVEHDMEAGLIEILESCFEDDPAHRPRDAEQLVEKIAGIQNREIEPEDDASRPDVAGRTRTRRADVWQLFDTLEQTTPELRKAEENSFGMKFVLIPQGTFRMGSPEHEKGRRINEGPIHDVMFQEPFYLGVHPVTQHMFRSLMGDNPARFQSDAGGGPNHPVENITWEDAVLFCQKLSQHMDERKARRKYRLPTEAEWEYACRAGANTPFSFGETLTSRQANYDFQFPYNNGEKAIPLRRTTPVGSYPSNHFGVHDMHGNVWEWCADWLHSDYYAVSPKRHPQGPEEGRFRVLRGGSWRNHAATCRCAYRNGLGSKQRDPTVGFRVVLELK